MYYRWVLAGAMVGAIFMVIWIGKQEVVQPMLLEDEIAFAEIYSGKSINIVTKEEKLQKMLVLFDEIFAGNSKKSDARNRDVEYQLYFRADAYGLVDHQINIFVDDMEYMGRVYTPNKAQRKALEYTNARETMTVSGEMYYDGTDYHLIAQENNNLSAKTHITFLADEDERLFALVGEGKFEVEMQLLSLQGHLREPLSFVASDVDVKQIEKLSE